MSKKGQYLFMGEALTTNGERGPFALDGDHAIAIYGVLGGATVSLYHKMPAKDSDTPLGNLAQDTEMTFTTLPAPFRYALNVDLPLYFNITGATGTTNLYLAAFKLED
jgi:hypothetical protein